MYFRRGNLATEADHDGFLLYEYTSQWWFFGDIAALEYLRFMPTPACSHRVELNVPVPTFKEMLILT